jgi:thiol-disulfide isomerase/thioredoxin
MKRLAFTILVAVFALVLAVQAEERPPPFPLLDAPIPVPEITFAGGDGTLRTLADYRGTVVLLNIWATWCIPCRTEMPTLDRLQGALGGSGFEVVALSIDRGGPEVVKKFFGEIGIQHLNVDVDLSGQVAFSLGVIGLPATLLIDRNGMEIGRLIGPAEWDAPEIVALLKSAIAADPAAPINSKGESLL